MKRLLVVANDFPYPPTHGAAVDMWNRILILREMGYGVDLLASVKEVPDEDRMRAVRNYVENLWVVPRRRAVTSVLSFLPLQVRSRIDLQDVELDRSYDGVILEADYVAPFLNNPAARHSRIILRIHNEQVGYFRDLAKGSKSWFKKLYFHSESFKFRFFSSPVMRKCDLLWFISDSEREQHVRRNPQDGGKSYFLPTHVSPTDLRPFVRAGKSRTALFIGTLTITHNLDSVVWYIENVHPLLSDTVDYAFQVAGRTAGRPIPTLRDLVQQSKNVSLETDPVVLDGLYSGASVFVNPVIRGAGVKIKVVQALEAGLPVVTTALGIEGTGFKDSVHVLVADKPEEFADCVRRLLSDPALAESLVRNSQEFLRERYDMKLNVQKTLSKLLEGGI